MSNVWTEVLLGIIAFATLTIALVYLGLFLAAWMVARHVARLVDRIEAHVTPILDELHSVARDAARITSLAGTQAERADHLVADVAGRLEQILVTIQDTVLIPVREGRALMGALGAGVRAVFDVRGRRQGP